jgi:hypothetical protein
LALLWINMKMDDSQIFPTPLHESLPCWILTDSVEQSTVT